MCRGISMQWRGLDGDKADDTTGKAPGDPHEFRAELLESRTPCTVPRQCENTRITFPCCSSCWGGCPRQKGVTVPTLEDPGSWEGSGMVGNVRLFCGRGIGSSAKRNKTKLCSKCSSLSQPPCLVRMEKAF